MGPIDPPSGMRSRSTAPPNGRCPLGITLNPIYAPRIVTTTKRPRRPVHARREHRVHRCDLSDCWCDPRWPRACMLAHSPTGPRKAAQEAAALQLEIMSSTWAVSMCHAGLRQGALSFIGADDVFCCDLQQSFGDDTDTRPQNCRDQH